MKIFFPIIAALILLCLGSCGYANYCKKPGENNEEDEVDRHEEVYSLSKPDRPYLTPHYQEKRYSIILKRDKIKKFWKITQQVKIIF